MDLLKTANEKLLLHFNFFDEDYDLTIPASRKYPIEFIENFTAPQSYVYLERDKIELV